MLSEAQNEMLAAPLSTSVVKRNPKGHDYIEGWHAIAEANRIFGFGGWSRELISLAIVGEPYQVNNNWRVGYRATVRITVLSQGATPIIREGTGYGSGITKDLNDAHEGAVKEAETDAMKRALMTFGNPFGLALYDKERANVQDDPEPLPAKVEAMLAAIRACQTVKALNEWKAANAAAANATGFGGLIVGEWTTRKEGLDAVAAVGAG